MRIVIPTIKAIQARCLFVWFWTILIEEMCSFMLFSVPLIF